MQYKRILLKLSGEALMGEKQYGIDPKRIAEYAEEIKEVVDKGIQVAIVIGGGNIFRGLAGAATGMDRVQGDHMGMLATVINALALQSALEKMGHEIISSGFERIPTTTKTLSGEQVTEVEKLLDKLEEDEDVMNVFHTMVID